MHWPWNRDGAPKIVAGLKDLGDALGIEEIHSTDMFDDVVGEILHRLAAFVRSESQ